MAVRSLGSLEISCKLASSFPSQMSGMSNNESSLANPAEPSTTPAVELSSGSGAPSIEDLDTTPTPSEVEEDTYHLRVPRKDPEPGEFNYSGLDMDRPSKITEK